MNKESINISLNELSAEAPYKLIDIRTDEEINAEPLRADCSCILMDALLESPDLIDKNDVVIFVCAAGIRSKFVAEVFRSQGYENVYSLGGGVPEVNRN